MKHFTLSAFLLGMGFGLILSFFILISAQPKNRQYDILDIPDSIVIQRAKELGLIDPTEGIDKEAIRID